jgi:hypothetical protein
MREKIAPEVPAHLLGLFVIMAGELEKSKMVKGDGRLFRHR